MRIVQRLGELPETERRDELETLIFAEFRGALLMAPDEVFPTETSFFDLGLTSVVLIELKERLERLLDITIDATVLFNEPTVDRLVTHLSDVLFGEGSAR